MALNSAAYRFYSERTKLVISLFFIVGGLIVLGSTVFPGIWGSICLSLGMSMISLGAFSTTSEYFLKTALTDDLLSKIQLRKEIAESGFSWVKAERDVPWAEVFSSSKEIECIVTAPEAFQQSVWPHLLAEAKSRVIHAQIFLCMESSGAGSADQASLLSPNEGVGQGQMSEGTNALEVNPSSSTEPKSINSANGVNMGSTIYKVAKNLESAWSQGKFYKVISSRSELRIAISNEAAQCAIFCAGERRLVLLGSPSGSHEDGTGMLFENGGSNALAAEWTASVVRRCVEAADDVWTDMKKKGSI